MHLLLLCLFLLNLPHAPRLTDGRISFFPRRVWAPVRGAPRFPSDHESSPVSLPRSSPLSRPGILCATSQQSAASPQDTALRDDLPSVEGWTAVVTIRVRMEDDRSAAPGRRATSTDQTGRRCRVLSLKRDCFETLVPPVRTQTLDWQGSYNHLPPCNRLEWPLWW